MHKLPKKTYKKIKNFRKDYDSNWNIFLVFLAIIMIWRWIQDLLTIYLFPNQPFISCVICIVIWLIILLIDDWKIDELTDRSEK